MSQAHTEQTIYYPIAQIGQGLNLDLDDSPCLYQELAPDLVRRLDVVLEVTDAIDALYLLSQIDALEIHLNEPHALFPGERDTGGIDVTEYPFG